MKEKLDPARDVLGAQMVIRAAYAGNLDFIREAIEAGAETGVLGSDVPHPDFNGLDPRSVGFYLTSHEHLPGEPLNAALYAAAYFGQFHVVQYLIDRDLVDQKSLDIALIAAAHLNEPLTAHRLIDAGADTRYGGYRAIECALTCRHMKTARAMLDACPDANYVLTAEVTHGTTETIARALDRKPDPENALKKLCALLSDRQSLRNRLEVIVEHGLDTVTMLLAYAETADMDCSHLAAITMQTATSEWASPVIEKLLGYAPFYAHKDAQALLDSALSRTAFSIFSGFDLAYKNHEVLCRKLLGCGASPQALLPAASERGIKVLAEMATESNADPRFSRIEESTRSPIAIVDQKILQNPDDKDFVAVRDIFNNHAAMLDARDHAAFEQLSAQGLDATVLRATYAYNKTGLMLAAIAGNAVTAVDKLANDPQKPLVAEDIFNRPNKDLSLLDIVETRGETTLLLQPQLWYGRAAAFDALATGLTERIGNKYADHIKDTYAAITAEDNRQQLRRTTRQRFKMGFQ